MLCHINQQISSIQRSSMILSCHLLHLLQLMLWNLKLMFHLSTGRHQGTKYDWCRYMYVHRSGLNGNYESHDNKYRMYRTLEYHYQNYYYYFWLWLNEFVPLYYCYNVVLNTNCIIQRYTIISEHLTQSHTSIIFSGIL